MIEIKHQITGTVLHRADTLVGTDLSGADLRHAYLYGADLTGANLSGANLNLATLSLANMTGVDLRRSTPISANLILANLTNANMTGAFLIGANLTNATLLRAEMSRAEMGDTTLLHCKTLHQAEGLDKVKHLSSSFLDQATLQHNVEHLPDVFLRGVGYNDEEIDTLRALYGKAFRYYSCFISYARSNDAFASRLHADLQASNVTCWKDTEDMKGGDYWHAQIDDAIRLRDKTVLVCSKDSLIRPAVIEELLESISLQDKTGQMKLFPIRLDNFIFSDEITAVGKEQTAKGKWPKNWLSEIRAFHIPDFSRWETNAEYQKAFQKLLSDLKAKPA